MLPGISMPMAGMTEAAIEVILSTSSTNLDVSTLFSAPDWASPIKKRVIVPGGVTRGSLVRTSAALRSGTGRGGLLEFVINGTVEGCGAPATTTLVAGLDGGDCILAEQSGVTVLGSGTIRSGGGAGGKGGNGSNVEGPFYSPDYTYIWAVNFSNPMGVNIYWAGVRAGGYGYPDGTYPPETSYAVGGYTYLRGASYGPNGGYNFYRYGVSRYLTAAGQNTTSGNSGRGQGHDGAKSNGIAGGTNSGLSGNGGDWGASGTAGAAGNAGGGTAAGLAGYALKNTVNITNLFTGTLQGRTG